MTEPLISALTQVPFVLAPIYIMLHILKYLRQRDEDWQHFIEQRDQQHTHEHQEIVRSIARLTEVTLTHDAIMREQGQRPASRAESFRVAQGGR